MNNVLIEPSELNDVYLETDDQNISLTNIIPGSMGYHYYPQMSYLKQFQSDIKLLVSDTDVDINSISVHMIPIDAPRSPLEYTQLLIEVETQNDGSLSIHMKDEIQVNTSLLVNYFSQSNKQSIIALQEPLAALKYLFRRDSDKNSNLAMVDLHVATKVYPEDSELKSLLNYWQSQLNGLTTSRSRGLFKDAILESDNKPRMEVFRVLKKPNNSVSDDKLNRESLDRDARELLQESILHRPSKKVI